MDRTIMIVSGLPRSGTSLMMQICGAGGMEVVTDNVRVADEDNPRGYYEFEKVKKIKEDSSWLDDVQGKIVKMVSDLLYYLPADRRYKVIFMERNMGEILSSQKKMLERREVSDDTTDEEMKKLFKRHLDELGVWLEEQESIDVLYINYNDVIESPRKNAVLVNEFLGRNLNIEKMEKVVEISLYRNRE